MRFLVLTLCVCAANAASYDYQHYRNFKPTQQVTKIFAQAVVKPAGTVPIAAAKTAYDAVEIVAAAPVIGAKTGYPGASKDSNAGILRFLFDLNSDGYSYNYKTANGISSQASGILKKVNSAEVMVSQGSYKYEAPDGTPIELTYVADENGYQPRGTHLPVAPPIPDAILRSLEYIRTHPQKLEK